MSGRLVTGSAFVPEIGDPWVEVELGVRVHDEILAIAYHTCDDALMRLLIADYFEAAIPMDR